MKDRRRTAPGGEAAKKRRAGAVTFLLVIAVGALSQIAAPFERKALAPGAPSIEVEFLNGTTTLPGTLFQARTAGSGPGVVILGGSERGARSEYKKRIAANFAEMGVSALIYDSPGNALLQTKNDRIAEALAAVEFLRSRHGIDPARIGLWGISEGAGIALLAAAREPRLAFVISVSSALGIAPMEISRFRIEMSGYENRLSSEDIARALVLEEILYDLFSGAGLAEWRLIGMKIRNWPDEPWLELVEAVKACRREASLPGREKAKNLLIRSLESWKDKGWFAAAVVDVALFKRIASLDTGSFFAFLSNNPWAKGDWLDHLRTQNDLSALRCPVLAVWGEKDRFLPPYRSAAVLKRLLANGKTDLTSEVISGVGHTMMRAPEERVAAEYDKIVATWLSSKVLGHKT